MKALPEFDVPLAPLRSRADDLRQRALWSIYRRAVEAKHAPWIEEEWTNRAKREREVRRLISGGLLEERCHRVYSWDPPADLENATLEEGRVLEEQGWSAYQEALRFLTYSFFRIKGDPHEPAVAFVREALGPLEWDCPVASAADVQMFAARWEAEFPASTPAAS